MSGKVRGRLIGCVLFGVCVCVETFEMTVFSFSLELPKITIRDQLQNDGEDISFGLIIFFKS